MNGYAVRIVMPVQDPDVTGAGSPRAGRLRQLARSRLVWSLVVLVGGLAAGAFLSAEANPAASAAVRDLSADAAQLRPYDGGTLTYVSSVRKFSVVGFNYDQGGIAEVRGPRDYFASEFARLGYRPVRTDQGRSLVTERFCKGPYEAAMTYAPAAPKGIAIAFSWGQGVACP